MPLWIIIQRARYIDCTNSYITCHVLMMDWGVISALHRKLYHDLMLTLGCAKLSTIWNWWTWFRRRYESIRNWFLEHYIRRCALYATMPSTSCRYETNLFVFVVYLLVSGADNPIKPKQFWYHKLTTPKRVSLFSRSFSLSVSFSSFVCLYV